MASQKCDQCGAPLSGGEVGLTVVCAYCGTDNRLRAMGNVRHTGAPRQASGVAVAVIAAVVVAVAAAGIVLFVVFSRRSSNSDGASTASDRGAPANLKALGEDQPALANLDRSGLKGSLESFDVTGNLPWVLRVARTWAVDARLTGIDVQGILGDGTVDASKNGSALVHYNFSSAGRDAAARELSKVSTKLSVNKIQLMFTHGSVEAKAVFGPYYDAPIDADVAFKCSFEAMLRMWRSKGLPVQPFYYIRLDRRSRPGGKGPFAEWTSKDWALQTVDPQTCQPL